LLNLFVGVVVRVKPTPRRALCLWGGEVWIWKRQKGETPSLPLVSKAKWAWQQKYE
jgi:hypothetical protein